ncbi:hypothetical protein [Mobiluncus porci]|uniref:hypothetical protein n=2 Tax=Actinomycetaceae TaxID=2049 RepID=UPI002A9152D5|nr:hypothetical protein [Mobiluncus porci]
MASAYQPYQHPQEQIIMILAILGLFTSGITAFIGWYIGSKAKKEMEAQGMAPTSNLKNWTMVSMVISIITIVVAAISLLFIIGTFVLMAIVGIGGITMSEELALGVTSLSTSLAAA